MNNRHFKLLATTFSLLLFLLSCTGNTEKTQTIQEPPAAAQETPAAAAETAVAPKDSLAQKPEPEKESREKAHKDKDGDDD